MTNLEIARFHIRQAMMFAETPGPDQAYWLAQIEVCCELYQRRLREVWEGVADLPRPEPVAVKPMVARQPKRVPTPRPCQLEERIGRLEARLVKLQGATEQERGRVLAAGWDLGGIRTPAGRRRRGQAVEASVTRAVEIVALTQKLAGLRAKRGEQR